jgi:signal transduction histidine kinase
MCPSSTKPLSSSPLQGSVGGQGRSGETSAGLGGSASVDSPAARLRALLLEPGPRLTDPSLRSTARLFAGGLLALILSFSVYDVYLSATRPDYEAPWPGYVLLLLAYGLLKRGFYTTAALLTLTMIPTVAFALVTTGGSPEPSTTLALPVLSVMLATLLVDARSTALLAVYSLALVSATTMVSGPHRVDWSTAAGPLLIVGLGGAIGVLSILHRARLERERRRALESEAAELELRVQARTKELADTIQELESFSYSVSHDLRAPLRAIQGFAAILEEDLGETLGTEGREHLAVIQQSSARMSSLIDGLLQLSRLARAPLSRRRLDLAATAREVIRSLSAASPDRQVEFACPESLFVTGDGPLTATILENLLGNAWKFTERRAAARIELGVELCEDRPRYFVRDNGEGFDMAHAGRLFRPFERLHKDSDFTGTGIGLATVARAVARHGGRIFAESAPGRGATFYFELGGDSADEPARAPQSSVRRTAP